MASYSSSPSDQDLLFEQAPAPWMWLLIGVVGLGFLAMAIASLPPKKGSDWGMLAVGGILGAFAMFAAVLLFKTRHDRKRFYRDHVEVYRRGVLKDRLAYGDVEYVAYGFRSMGTDDQFLHFSGKHHKPRIAISHVGPDKNAGGKTLTSQKLLQLRDLLYGVVADRMRQSIAQHGRVHWFKSVEIAHDGVYIGGTFIPSNQVNLSANDSTGAVSISGGGVTERTSMIEDNVVPGLMVVQGEQEEEGDELSV